MIKYLKYGVLAPLAFLVTVPNLTMVTGIVSSSFFVTIEAKAQDKRTRRVPALRHQVFKEIQSIQTAMDAEDFASMKSRAVALLSTEINEYERAVIYQLLSSAAFSQEDKVAATYFLREVLRMRDSIPAQQELSTYGILMDLHFAQDDFDGAYRYAELQIDRYMLLSGDATPLVKPLIRTVQINALRADASASLRTVNKLFEVVETMELEDPAQDYYRIKLVAEWALGNRNAARLAATLLYEKYPNDLNCSFLRFVIQAANENFDAPSECDLSIKPIEPTFRNAKLEDTSHDPSKEVDHQILPAVIEFGSAKGNEKRLVGLSFFEDIEALLSALASSDTRGDILFPERRDDEINGAYLNRLFSLIELAVLERRGETDRFQRAVEEFLNEHKDLSFDVRSSLWRVLATSYMSTDALDDAGVLVRSLVKRRGSAQDCLLLQELFEKQLGGSAAVAEAKVNYEISYCAYLPKPQNISSASMLTIIDTARQGEFLIIEPETSKPPKFGKNASLSEPVTYEFDVKPNGVIDKKSITLVYGAPSKSVAKILIKALRSHRYPLFELNGKKHIIPNVRFTFEPDTVP